MRRLHRSPKNVARKRIKSRLEPNDAGRLIPDTRPWPSPTRSFRIGLSHGEGDCQCEYNRHHQWPGCVLRNFNRFGFDPGVNPQADTHAFGLVVSSGADSEGFAAITGSFEAGNDFFAAVDIEILRSIEAASRRTTEAPRRPCSQRGRISGRLLGASEHSTAPIAAKCQSFLDNVIAQFGGVRARDDRAADPCRIPALAAVESSMCSWPGIQDYESRIRSHLLGPRGSTR